MYDVILDTLIDSLKLIPFLFIAFLIIELIEHKVKSKDIIKKSGKYGPVIGGLLGLFPQCGFSVLATNLYVTRIITLGTLISIYLSTSDEMLPLLISYNVKASLILKILLIKLIVGILYGFIIDLILRKTRKKDSTTYDICESEHCHCEKGILKSSLVHTLKTVLFVLIVSFILNILLHYEGTAFLSKLFLKNSLFGPFVSSLVGLIPNCASSILITELYLNNAITFGSLLSGLLTGSGVAILILFKSNKNIKENVSILLLVYSLGVLTGIVIDLILMLI